jgi:hypothetical protein
MAIAARNSIPLAVTIDSASPHKSNLVDETLSGSFLDELAERLVAWLQWFRRLVTRYEFHAENFLGMVRLADEVRYIQDKAAEHDLRMVTIGRLILFSIKTGDAWLLDVTDEFAGRLARDGDPEPIHLEETDTSFAIGWKGQYSIDGHAFLYSDRETRRVTTILGYPTKRSLKPDDLKISYLFG